MSSAAITQRAISASTASELRAHLRGELLEPDAASYDEVRQLWNADIQRYPAVIARCVDVADVIACVKWARSHDVRASVRCAGHNISGAASCEGGLVIDLGPMRGTRVDLVAQRIRAQGGCTWGEVDHAAQAFGLATTGGVNSITGIGGLTLGGGIGWLMRKHGLACDNLVAADVVTAEGELIRTDAEENPDLLWALRGGGGNFGIVTEFEYQLHRVGPLLAGLLMYSGERATDMLRFYRELAADEPEELTSFVIILNAPKAPELPRELHGARTVALCPAWSGDLGEGERVMDRLRQFGKPVVDTVDRISYVDLQKGSDEAWQPGFGRYWKSDYLRELPDEAIEVIVNHCDRFKAPTAGAGHADALSIQPTCFFEIGHMEGAISRVGDDESAVGHRSAPYLHGTFTVWREPGDREEQIRWATELWEALLQYSDGGAYVNYLGEEGEDRIRGSYGEEKYARLVDVKTKYDPTNFFTGQQNIKPRSA
ncbi:MAG: FAD-binding oxidoreductase [Actinomycetia bacterium]|nr:FAD-binding oxidoreductase [Actinomycetes bacterium]